jgi:hypothetical protein
MIRRVVLIRTDVSEKIIASVIRVRRIDELGTLAVTSNRSILVDSCQPDDAGDTFLRNVGSYKRHTASHS